MVLRGHAWACVGVCVCVCAVSVYESIYVWFYAWTSACVRALVWRARVVCEGWVVHLFGRAEGGRGFVDVTRRANNEERGRGFVDVTRRAHEVHGGMAFQCRSQTAASACSTQAHICDAHHHAHHAPRNKPHHDAPQHKGLHHVQRRRLVRDKREDLSNVVNVIRLGAKERQWRRRKRASRGVGRHY